MAVAAAEAGGLGSFPCAGLTDDKVREGVAAIRSRTKRPINLNFFCHAEPEQDIAREAAWLERLAPYYAELGVEMPKPPLKATIYRFTEATCGVVEELRPEVVSFHFGLPGPELVQRVKQAGCKVICSATTRREALWLTERGVDAIIAQGAEAGGHRGMFLETDIATQIGTFALVQQIVAAVRVPVIAAGGIGDAKGIAAAFALGAAGVQIGTAYLCCPEATTSALHRQALAEPGRDDGDRRCVERAAGPRNLESLHHKSRGQSIRRTRVILSPRPRSRRCAKRPRRRDRAIFLGSGRGRGRCPRQASAPAS